MEVKLYLKVEKSYPFRSSLVLLGVRNPDNLHTGRELFVEVNDKNNVPLSGGVDYKEFHCAFVGVLTHDQ